MAFFKPRPEIPPAPIGARGDSVASEKGGMGDTPHQDTKPSASAGVNPERSRGYGSLHSYKLPQPQDKIGDPFSVRFFPHQRAWIRGEAERQGVQEAEIVRQAVEAARVEERIIPCIIHCRSIPLTKYLIELKRIADELFRHARSFYGEMSDLGDDEIRQKATWVRSSTERLVRRVGDFLGLVGGLTYERLQLLRKTKADMVQKIQELEKTDPSTTNGLRHLVEMMESLGVHEEDGK